MAELRRLYAKGDIARARRVADDVRRLVCIPRDAVPIIVAPLTSLITLRLDRTSAFLITRIDGSATVREILDASPFAAGVALRYLDWLIACCVVALASADDEPTLTRAAAPEDDAPTVPLPPRVHRTHAPRGLTARSYDAAVAIGTIPHAGG